MENPKKIRNFGDNQDPKISSTKQAAGQSKNWWQEQSGDTRGDWTGQTSQIAQEQLEIFSENFGTPSNDVGYIEPWKDPQ